MSLIERDRVAAALRDEFSAWIAGHPNAGVFDWSVAAENVLRAANPPGAVSLLAAIGQCANTHDALDETASVRVPLRLLRAARSTGTGGSSPMTLIERKLAEKCASFGLPPSFDALMRHIENNHAATVGAQRSHIESLERQLRGTVEDADRLREVLRAVLMEPDPIKRNQLAAPVLTNPGGK
jgi:hypothetical protein